ncbi:FMN-binding split barrel [Parasponia andersonii]|uniref:FMN-binding split barrel n=1 Tax=Parasponia andersonii TaxID=3476 RepID=A0A2P5CB05_PARAD|nr:FMN-binding split barrel [Parasponia andersonii]
MTLRFSAAAPYYRSMLGSEDVTGAVHVASSRDVSHTCGFVVPWNRFRRRSSGSLRRCSLIRNRIHASTKHLGPGSDPIKQNGKPQYHPFEDIAKSIPENGGGDARLTSAETARTIIEVNSKATLMFSNLINDELHENIIWPELPYVTDEHGNIYFQLKEGGDTMQTLTSENNFVQVIIGLDAMEMINEMELSGPSEIDFGIDEIEDEDSDVEDGDGDGDEDEGDEDNDDYDTDWVAVLEDDDDSDDSDEALGDWAKLETMRASHPMFFAKKLAEVASDNPVDWMEQPPASLAIQGLVTPAFIEEHSVIRKHLSNQQSSNADLDQVGESVEDNSEDLGRINGCQHESDSSKDSSNWQEELEKDEITTNGATFYKLEMIKIQLFSAHAHQTLVELEDFMKAQPDAIAHSAAKIVSRLKAGGEKTTQALRSLCWRVKGIQVEEAVIIGVDSLGFDLRICSGTQVQTLRFAFDTRATSEYGAERQLNDLLFSRNHHKSQKIKQTQQNEC